MRDTIEKLYKNLNGAAPTPEQQDALDRIRAAAKILGAAIIENAPSSSERSVALTRLEEAAMWASKAVVVG